MKRSFTSEEGAALCVKACLNQIEVGRVQTLLSEDTKGPFELRKGLRKLRTALGLFEGAIDSPKTRELAEQAKWLGHQVGKTRDLEVALYEIFEPAISQDGGDLAKHPFLEAVRAALNKERHRLRALLDGRRVRQFMASLQDYVAHRQWLVSEDITQTKRLAMPLGEFADLALSDRWKRTSRKAKYLGQLSIQQSHELRKALKKLRYSVEFLAPLYSARRISPYLKRLKALQTIYGTWNDSALAETMFEQLARRGVSQISNIDGIACAIKGLHIRAAAKMAEAGPHWRKLKEANRPWA